MKKAIFFTISVVFFLCVWSSIGFAGQGDKILGYWITEGGKSCVELFAKKDRYFARIVALKDPTFSIGEVEGMDGKTRIDIHNPEESLRSRPLIGIEFMENFQFSGNGKWEKGKIYDPESGKIYQCIMTLKKDGVLDVRGFIGVAFLGRSTKWMRPDVYLKATGQPLGFDYPRIQLSQKTSSETATAVFD